jgi:hypothetical protein
MKYLILIFLLINSFSIKAQECDIFMKCFDYGQFSASECEGCNIDTAHFSGIIIYHKLLIVPLYRPVKVTYRNASAYFSDAFGTRFTAPLAQFQQNVPEFVSDCNVASGTVRGFDYYINNGDTLGVLFKYGLTTDTLITCKPY